MFDGDIPPVPGWQRLYGQEYLSMLAGRFHQSVGFSRIGQRKAGKGGGTKAAGITGKKWPYHRFEIGGNVGLELIRPRPQG